MQARFHEASLAVAGSLLERIESAQPDHIATDCPLAALRIREGLGRSAVHPVVLMHRAYGLGEA
jgi:Fe-S oxidoreductase